MQRKLLLKLMYSIPIVCIGSFLLSNHCNAASSATLTLGTTQKLETTVTQGNTAYLSSTIKVDATDIESYTLSITGPVGLTGGSTITGAGGKTPSNMADNTWGYAYNDSNANSSKTYQSFTGSTQTLETGTTPSGQAKNITFAAKFASNATSTHYTAQVTVNLVATPKKVAGIGDWTLPNGDIISSGIEYMQNALIYDGSYGAYSFCISGGIPSGVPVGATIALKDKRDEKTYTIRKMEDSKCWMTQNLALAGNRTLTSTDSNVSSDWDLPASNMSGFSDDSISDVYLPEDGSTAYYSWCAATAGTCTSATSGGQNAPSSICPNNWKLPTGGSGGEFQSLYTALGNPSSAILQSSPYNFAYTGEINNGPFYEPDSDKRGIWWSRTAHTNVTAYILKVYDAGVATLSSYRRYFGIAVRCVANNDSYAFVPD